MTNRLPSMLGSLLVGSLLAAGCGGAQSGPCESANPPPQCAQTCDPARKDECGAGYHCNLSGTCYAYCTPGGSECGSDLVCTADGRCIGSNVDAAPLPDSSCANIMFTATSVTPSIQLVIDRSGSMGQSFAGGGGSKWNALKDALVGTTGVVTTLESKAYFGTTIYPGGNNCNQFDQTTRVLTGASAVRTALDARGPGGNTPTGAAVQLALAGFATTPPPAGSPPIIVLATDGDPNQCDNGDIGAGQALSVQAATAVKNANIGFYVLAMGLGQDSLDRLQLVANAGHPMGTGTVYRGDSPQGLKTAFDQIIGGVVSCQLDVSGMFNPAQASQGTVRLNGRMLNYGTEWKEIDGDTLELLGTACNELKTTPNPTVTADFPCGVVVN